MSWLNGIKTGELDLLYYIYHLSILDGFLHFQVVHRRHGNRDRIIIFPIKGSGLLFSDKD